MAVGDPGLHQRQSGSAGSSEDQNRGRVSSKWQNKHECSDTKLLGSHRLGTKHNIIITIILQYCQLYMLY